MALRIAALKVSFMVARLGQMRAGIGLERDSSMLGTNMPRGATLACSGTSELAPMGRCKMTRRFGRARHVSPAALSLLSYTDSDGCSTAQLGLRLPATVTGSLSLAWTVG